MIRLLIADDHQLFRQGLKVLLAPAKDIEVIGEARDGLEAVELAQQLQPDVILMDIEMPRLNGLRSTAQLRTLGIASPILILSMRMDDQDVRMAVACGAQGYLIKNTSRDQLITAIRTVHRGGRIASPEVAHVFDSTIGT